MFHRSRREVASSQVLGSSSRPATLFVVLMMCCLLATTNTQSSSSLVTVYNLELNADLAVLSACQTALGKQIKGEGLMGLTRGFMYAGVRRVAASLWRVDDRATAELMKRFYHGMLKDRLRPAAALRAAQVSMLKQRRWSAPQYWAAFYASG